MFSHSHRACSACSKFSSTLGSLVLSQCESTIYNWGERSEPLPSHLNVNFVRLSVCVRPSFRLRRGLHHMLIAELADCARSHVHGYFFFVVLHGLASYNICALASTIIDSENE